MSLKKASLVLALTIIFLPRLSFAYEIPTHAYLTHEIWQFYNHDLSTAPLTEEDAQFLIDGAMREDDTPRFMNHFYDPVYERGLTPDNAIDPIYRLGAFGTSKDWAQNVSRQTGPAYLGIRRLVALLGPLNEGINTNDTAFTWQSGIQAYASENRRQAMFALGHILHLIEDLAVPEHTRNDPHGAGSPYEKWAGKFSLSRADPSLKNGLDQKQAIKLSALNDYFNQLAVYTNNNFYSPHTIGIQSGYSSPQPEGFENTNHGFYALSNTNGKYPLYLKTSKNGNFLLTTVADVTLQDDELLQAYWNRLAPKAVQYGAGVIQLFIAEGEKARQNSIFIKEKPKSLLGQVVDVFQSVIDHFHRTPSEDMPIPNIELPTERAITRQDLRSTSTQEKAVSPPESASASFIEQATSPIQSATPATIPPPAPIKEMIFNGGPEPQMAAQNAPVNTVLETPNGDMGTATDSEVSLNQNIITNFQVSIASGTLHFSWGLATTAATSTVKDLTGSSPSLLYSGSDTFFDASSTVDGLEHLFELIAESENASSSATTTLSMPSPPPPPLLPGINNFHWSINNETHGVDFTGTLITPTEGQVRMDMSFTPAAQELPPGGTLASDFVDSGEPATIHIPSVESGTYHWHARLVYRSTIGFSSLDWTPTEEAVIMIVPGEPKASSVFSQSDFGELCVGNKVSFSPSEDFILSSAEFYAGCANGRCYAPNTFQIYDASSTLLAESDGANANFGYPAVAHIWQNFIGANKIMLHAGEAYYAAPVSQNGQCFVNPYDPAKNAFFLR